MILPNKHIPLERTLLGLGAQLLGLIHNGDTVSSLWERARKLPDIGNFSRFILTLDFLYIIGIVEFHNGLLGKREQE